MNSPSLYQLISVPLAVSLSWTLLFHESGRADPFAEPETWARYDVGHDGDPSNDFVLQPGPPGSWDAWCYYPSVVNVAGVYRMWYTGWDGSQTRIGLATSVNGAVWTKYDVGSDGDHSNDYLIQGYGASVLHDGGLYRMWYGSPSTLDMKYAESPDGITWTEHGTVLERGGLGAWDSSDCSWGSVVKDGAAYRMWYGGRGPSTSYSIGYAVSVDGIHWEKYDVGSNTNPADDMVLGAGPAGAWDSQGVNDPTVVRLGNEWHMWYQGWQAPGQPIRIGHATSADGVSWVKYDRFADADSSNDFVLDVGVSGAWDHDYVWSPWVLAEGTTVRMWYTGWSDTNPGRQIGYAAIGVIPEPFSIAFIGSAFVGVVAYRFRRRRRHGGK